MRLHDVFTASARARGDAPAVGLRGRWASYRELDAASDAWAARLAAAGLCGERVALLSGKSIAAVAAALGALKAGAAYVPLDPRDPPERLRFKLADCGASAVLASAACAPALRAALPKRRAPLALPLEAAPPPAPAPRPAAPGGEAPAYLLYTSGSTGRPKAVVVSHRAARSFVDWAARAFALRPSDRLAGCAPLHFDLSVFDLFCAFESGASVAMVPEDAWAFPQEVAAFVERERPTVWYSVPSALTQLLAAEPLPALSSLRAVLFAGEVFPLEGLRRLREAAPRAALYNLYGPTETNVCAYHAVRRLPRAGSVPIGRACAGSRLAVVDEEGRPARPGRPGRLLVGGPSLMSGYWDALRGRAVLPRAARAPRGGAWYDTGDLVARGASGLLTFLGRRDDMVKVRGHRVFLGEIEAVLARCPGVREAAALYEDGPAGGRLRAVIRRTGRADLRPLLRRALPDYMLPELVETHRPLPRTSRGKVDRGELARLAESRA